MGEAENSIPQTPRGKIFAKRPHARIRDSKEYCYFFVEMRKTFLHLWKFFQLDLGILPLLHRKTFLQQSFQGLLHLALLFQQLND